jgi:hypothetical protein
MPSNSSVISLGEVFTLDLAFYRIQPFKTRFLNQEK